MPDVLSVPLEPDHEAMEIEESQPASDQAVTDDVPTIDDVCRVVAPPVLLSPVVSVTRLTKATPSECDKRSATEVPIGDASSSDDADVELGDVAPAEGLERGSLDPEELEMESEPVKASPSDSNEAVTGSGDLPSENLASPVPDAPPTPSTPSPTAPGTSAAAPDTDPAAPSLPPTFPPPIEIVFSFDTTGSMSQCLDNVRSCVKDVIQRLFMDIPSLKIAVIAHGDYCDANVYYLYKAVDFTNDVEALCQFVQEVEATGGGDWQECYEFVLRQVHDTLSWTPGTQRAVVMIGDAVPHEKGYIMPKGYTEGDGGCSVPTSGKGKLDLDWREEVDKLHRNKGVSVYAVQCQKDNDATPFWEELSTRSDGKHLQLDQMNTVIDLMMAICYRERGPDFFEAYEREVRWREGPAIRKELDVMFDTLRDGRPVPALGAAASAVNPAAGAGPGSASKDRPKKAAKPKIKSRDRDDAPASLNKATKKALARLHTGVNYRVKATHFRTREEQRAFQMRRKAALRKKKLEQKKKKAKAGKQSRRTTTQKAFDCKMGLRWSSWRQVLEPGASGYALSPFKGVGDVPAVYEFAVQAAKGAKRQIVYCCSSERLPVGRTLRSYLLGRDKLKVQTDHVVAQGCCVFVRRCEVRRPLRCCMQKVKNAAELKRLILKHYEYEWNKTARKLTDVTIRGVSYCKTVSDAS